MIFLAIKTYSKILVVLIVTRKKRLKMALVGQMNIMIFLVIQTCSKILVALITKSKFFRASVYVYYQQGKFYDF